MPSGLRHRGSVDQRDLLRDRLGPNPESFCADVYPRRNRSPAKFQTVRFNLGNLDGSRRTEIGGRLTLPMLKDKALEILHEWVQSESLRRHCYAVADSINISRRSNGRGCGPWEAVGLLARHGLRAASEPGTEPERRPSVCRRGMVAGARDGVKKFVVRFFRTRLCRRLARNANGEDAIRRRRVKRVCHGGRQVRPSKSAHEVEVGSVKKKMKDKAFARAVNREDITHGAEGLGMPLDEVITRSDHGVTERCGPTRVGGTATRHERRHHDARVRDGGLRWRDRALELCRRHRDLRRRFPRRDRGIPEAKSRA